ncbi:hypothetical protein BGZ80_007142 [Entomortierella chlamydospora]|uniref:L-arabinokinase n=1 Tax=Entomortierella chlamydospora TaxID=101097 RepID=A0A9P6MYM4_9FUNG|nr:hypothetical protein BGZ79_008295 [Entomortierella chlamydospora]KAG0018471.1 hypothetical protein BGZ80_007142 [Entomortierella chlamydospora]
MTSKGYTFSYYVSGHGFGHATRVNQIITELLKSTTTATTTTSSTSDSTQSETSSSSSRHTIYIVSDAPEFIFQDVIALGAIYRNAKVDAGVVQPVAYYVDRKKTIEGCKQFLSRRDEMIQLEVSWLAQVGVDCVLADAPFLPCAAASAYGIPAILITNFTFDEVYRYLQEGDDFDKDVVACADAALEDYKKASLLLRLPGYIDIPSFEDEVLAMESTRSHGGDSPSISDMDDSEVDVHNQFSYHHQQHLQYNESQAADLAVRLAQKKKQQDLVQEEEEDSSSEANMDNATPAGVLSPINMRTAVSSPNSSLSNGRSRLQSITRKAIDVPLVVRMAVNTREVVLRSLGVDEETIATKKVALVSFGGQKLNEGWGSPLPEGWIGVICGLPADYELPAGFYRSPHGVYVPDLTEAADVVVGKLGYGTCSECIGHNTPLIYVPRPQFVEEHGLIKMMNNHGLAVEMTQEEFESGRWQRAILEADRQAEEEKEGRHLFLELNSNSGSGSCSGETSFEVALGGSIEMQAKAETESISLMEKHQRRRRRTESVTSLSDLRPKGIKMARFLEQDSDSGDHADFVSATDVTCTSVADMTPPSSLPLSLTQEEAFKIPLVWFKRKIPNNGGEVCAKLIEEFMAQLED